MQLGTQFAVVLNKPEIIIEVLQKKGTKTASRPKYRGFRIVSECDGIVTSSFSQRWRTVRKMAHSNLFTQTAVERTQGNLKISVDFNQNYRENRILG